MSPSYSKTYTYLVTMCYCFYPSKERFFPASHTNSPFVGTIDIGHKDTLLIIPFLAPLSTISLGITTGLRYDPKNSKDTGLRIGYLMNLKKLFLLISDQVIRMKWWKHIQVLN